MSKRRLRAILSCGRNLPGAEFDEAAHIARALVALKRAEYIDISVPTPIPEAPVGSPAAVVTPDPVIESAILISETVQAYAAEHGIESATVAGTGKDGRVIKRDIDAAIAARESNA